MQQVIDIKLKPKTTAILEDEELVQPVDGESPNVWWRSPTMDELRSARNFVALPLTDDIFLGKWGKRAHKYCRQGTQMFADLREGAPFACYVTDCELGWIEQAR